MNEPIRQPDGFSSFWPVFMMGVGLGLFLGWQVVLGARQHIALVRLEDQQAVLAGQAAQTETQLQSMMLELIVLAKKEPAAKAVIEKYNIKYNPPATSGGQATATTNAGQAQPESKTEAAPAAPAATNAPQAEKAE